MTRKQRAKNYPRKVEALVSDAHYDLLRMLVTENGFKGMAEAVRFVLDEYTDHIANEDESPRHSYLNGRPITQRTIR